MKEISQEEYLKIIEDWKLEHKEEITSGKCKKVFSELLPHRGNHLTSNIIDWKSSNGYKLYFIYENIEGWVEILNYILNKNNTRLNVKFQNNEFEISSAHFAKCKIGRILGTRTPNFKIEIGQTFKDDKRDITITNRKKVPNPHNEGKYLKYYQYKCNKCSFDCSGNYYIKGKEYNDGYWVEENTLTRGSGCACCCNPSKIVVESINSIYKTDPWMIPYIGEECAKTHTRGSNDKVKVKCPDCGKVKEKSININNVYKTHSMGCEICSDGEKYPNKFAYDMLKQLNIIFKREYSPTWIKPRRYDFYFELNNKKYILEMDGRFHNNNNHLSGQTKEESKVIDNYKDEQARLHDIEVIRIDCDYENNSCNRFEWIKQNILENNTLNNLFDLSKINWNKVEEFALTNLVKIACEYKKNDPELTTTEIGKIMGGYTKKGISNWLVQGSKLDWCEYNPKIENIKSAIKCGKANGKQVEIFKDGISLGVFESASELARRSEELFGVKLIQSCISSVCKTNKLHKGYQFKYVNKL